MRRVLIAVAVLLIGTASPSFADYLIIRVLLEGGGGGSGSGSGTPGGPPPGGLTPSTGGGPKGPAPGGPPPGGMPPGGMPPGGKSPMSGGTTASDFDHTRSVVVMIPLDQGLKAERLDKAKVFHPQNNPEFRKFDIPYYGRKLHTNLFVDSSSIQLYTELIDKPASKKTRTTEIRDKYLAWQKGKNDPRLLYEAVILALESGIIRDPILAKDGSPPKDAMTLAQELLDVAAEKKVALPADAQRFVTAWEQMHKAVKSPALQQSDAEDWRIKLDAKKVRVVEHYAIITWDSSDVEVKRRATQLNDNFIAFFMWHATRGIVLTVPTKPLVAVLPWDIREQVGNLRFALDTLPSQVDAFYTPDHNILVLSPERLDTIGQTFLSQTQQVFKKGLNPERLLDGDIPKIDSTGAKDSTPNDIARASTLALVEKLVVDEAELASVSREGSRQLLFTTGMLPKHVTLPNWLTEGAVNSFTRPRGPAFVTKGESAKPYMSVAFTTGYGMPNYVLQRYFSEMGDADHKELNPDRAKLLEHILTDAYFTGLKDAIDPDPAPPGKPKKPATPGGPVTGSGPGPAPAPGMGPPPGPGPGGLGPPPAPGTGPGATGPGTTSQPDDDPVVSQRKKRERLTLKSQATSWALYYYLSRARAAELKLYVAELNKLPRDLPIDGRTAFTAFVRVFKLSASEDGTPDAERMKKFAKDWLDYMGTVPEVFIDIPLVVPEPPKTTGGTGTGGPTPGGPPGPLGKN